MRQRIPGVRGEPLLGVAGDWALLGMGTMAAVPGPFPCLVSWSAALCLIHETKKHEGGRRTAQQKRPLHKASLPPASGRRGATATPPSRTTMTFPLSDCPSVQPCCQAREPHAGFLWKRAPAPGATSATAGPMAGSAPKLPITGKG